jgi:hypothetical protein
MIKKFSCSVNDYFLEYSEYFSNTLVSCFVNLNYIISQTTKYKPEDT